MSYNPALSARVPKDIPLDACVFVGKYDPYAAAWVFTTHRKLLEAQRPSFLSVKEVNSFEEADNCDIAIRISQPSTSSVKADIFSTETKELLISIEESGFFIFDPADKIISQIFSTLGEDTPLQKRLIQERTLRLARLETKKEESVKEIFQPDKQDSAAAIITGIQSDVDELPAAIATPQKNSYAIVIGIENYRQKLPQADFAVNDAKLVSEYLTKVMGYPEENIVLLTNDKALQSDLAKYFEKWLWNNVERDSTVFVYYSGHGSPNPRTGDAFLVPYDGDPSFIDQTGYSLKRMYEALGKLPAKEIIVALDSCFSGAGGRSVLAEGARPLVMNLHKSFAVPTNMTVLAAASGDQISSTYKEKGHGLFTYFMLKGIKNEDVVRQDGSIAVSDLFGYLKPQVERIARKQYNNEQTPQLIESKKH
ncbi:MAG: caspase family protein [Desulfobacteraceae bacterium]|uniref:Caspase family protein n=1 Tax=Candidatus Desulfaltia bathyphila TaxID=2841697 RepID=A0A8J6T9N3_9BACT|nr:caspase family protein [Candidatus Desulfaltia bathyphila]